jgi:hypothetical protein
MDSGAAVDYFSLPVSVVGVLAVILRRPIDDK